MSTSKHPLSGHGAEPLPNDDLERNPGIGQSRGLSGGKLEEIEGDNTVEGDTANDVSPTGEVSPRHRGHTNH